MSSTEAGRVWLRRALAWTVAFVLYKPAAAVVYATAFRLAGTRLHHDAAALNTPPVPTVPAGGGAPVPPSLTADQTSSGLVAVLTGLMLMVLALVALPALLRFLTPLVHATAGTPGRGAALAGALPTGAMALAGGARMSPSTMGRGGGASFPRPDGATGGGFGRGGGAGGVPDPRPTAPPGATPGTTTGATSGAAGRGAAGAGPVGAAVSVGTSAMKAGTSAANAVVRSTGEAGS
jgi:hypothetical protein